MSRSLFSSSRRVTAWVVIAALPLLASCGTPRRPATPAAPAARPLAALDSATLLATFTSGSKLTLSAWKTAVIQPWKDGVPVLRTTTVGPDSIVLMTAAMRYHPTACATRSTEPTRSGTPHPAEPQRVTFRAVLRSEGDRTATMARVEALGRALPCPKADPHLQQVAEDLRVSLALALRQR